MEEILKSNLETAYKEYKEYKNFLLEKSPELKERREAFNKLVAEGATSIEELTDILFETDVIKHMYENDIVMLQRKLLTIYDAVKECIEVPEELKTELAEIRRPKQNYKIENREAKEIDPEELKKTKEEAKRHYDEQLKVILKK